MDEIGQGHQSNHGCHYSNLCTDFIRLGVSPSRIPVIAPYSPHVKTIRTLLDVSDIACNIVYKMVGAENDIIIFATTRSNQSRDLGFVIEPESLNVATSRQLLKLVIVGDTKDILAKGSDTSKKIYDFIESKGSIILAS